MSFEDLPVSTKKIIKRRIANYEFVIRYRREVAARDYPVKTESYYQYILGTTRLCDNYRNWLNRNVVKSIRESSDFLELLFGLQLHSQERAQAKYWENRGGLTYFSDKGLEYK